MLLQTVHIICLRQAGQLDNNLMRMLPENVWEFSLAATYILYICTHPYQQIGSKVRSLQCNEKFSRLEVFEAEN